MARLMLGAVAGGVGGFAWYFFVGCATGTCPISSSPYASTVMGTLIGLLSVLR